MPTGVEKPQKPWKQGFPSGRLHTFQSPLVVPSLAQEDAPIAIADEKVFNEIVSSALEFEDLRSGSWKRQTDLVHQVFYAAAMISTYGKRALFIDVRIEEHLMREAVQSGQVKQFFNRRFHDLGVDWPRLVYFLTASKRKDGKRKRGPSNLHVHALIVIPEKITHKQVREKLALVFGKAKTMRLDRQIDITKPDIEKGCSWNGVKAMGPIGKLLYAQEGMGATYSDLGYNEDGKRSRKAPPDRRTYNKHSTGLAQGIPSNFNSKSTLCDNETKRLAQVGFDQWIVAEKARFEASNRTKAKKVASPPSSIQSDTPARGNVRAAS